MLSALLARLHLTRPRPQLLAGGQLRIAVCPPVRRDPAGKRGLWHRLSATWRDSSLTVGVPDGGEPSANATPLWAVRLEFMRALHGIRTPQADILVDRMGGVRSLRELWHLRAEVFDLVSHHHDQAEAHARVAKLNQHFPKRATNTGFGALDS